MTLTLSLSFWLHCTALCPWPVADSEIFFDQTSKHECKERVFTVGVDEKLDAGGD
jgi:cytochrome oxidase Cu insertion factor (SCO1/SenC/PrrC family)